MASSTNSKDALNSSQSTLPIAAWQLMQRLYKQIGRSAIALLSQTNEPRITHRIGSSGQSTWTIYDPYSKQTVTCYSVAEVRVWLENRYSASCANKGGVIF